MKCITVLIIVSILVVRLRTGCPRAKTPCTGCPTDSAAHKDGSFLIGHRLTALDKNATIPIVGACFPRKRKRFNGIASLLILLGLISRRKSNKTPLVVNLRDTTAAETHTPDYKEHIDFARFKELIQCGKGQNEGDGQPGQKREHPTSNNESSCPKKAKTDPVARSESPDPVEMEQSALESSSSNSSCDFDTDEVCFNCADQKDSVVLEGLPISYNGRTATPTFPLCLPCRKALLLVVGSHRNAGNQPADFFDYDPDHHQRRCNVKKLAYRTKTHFKEMCDVKDGNRPIVTPVPIKRTAKGEYQVEVGVTPGASGVPKWVTFLVDCGSQFSSIPWRLFRRNYSVNALFPDETPKFDCQDNEIPMKGRIKVSLTASHKVVSDVMLDINSSEPMASNKEKVGARDDKGDGAKNVDLVTPNEKEEKGDEATNRDTNEKEEKGDEATNRDTNEKEEKGDELNNVDHSEKEEKQKEGPPILGTDLMEKLGIYVMQELG